MARPRTKRTYQNNPELAEMSVQERVLTCGRDLFQQKTFEGVNIRDLMLAADVTQPVIYYHFKNKDGLFLAVVLDVLEEIDEFFRAAQKENQFQIQLKILARAFTQSPAPNVPLLLHDLSERVKLHTQNPAQGLAASDARQAQLYVHQVWPRALENMIRDAWRMGQIPATNPPFLSHYLLTLLSSYAHSPFNKTAVNNPELSANTLVDFLQSTLRTTNTSAQI
jgi:AcrR family transcriptional regulator